jgi:hypothetical protein
MAILSSVCLKMFVMWDFSFPMYGREARWGGGVVGWFDGVGAVWLDEEGVVP